MCLEEGFEISISVCQVAHCVALALHLQSRVVLDTHVENKYWTQYFYFLYTFQNLMCVHVSFMPVSTCLCMCNVVSINYMFLVSESTILEITAILSQLYWQYQYNLCCIDNIDIGRTHEYHSIFQTFSLKLHVYMCRFSTLCIKIMLVCYFMKL